MKRQKEEARFRRSGLLKNLGCGQPSSMDWITDIGRFLWAVINNWAGYSTGGIIVAVVALWHLIKNRPVPRKLGIGLAIFFFFLSFFKAWQDQYHIGNELQERLHAST